MFLKEMTIAKKILFNGLTILVKNVDNIPKVSTQLVYHVGSKDEKSGQKGLAHLIEHMIFKGTEKMSESDINVITHKLSGYCNAFTSYDTTGYVFDFPSQNWKAAIDLYADCMQNAKFDEQMLNSELKAVIQELKMYKDDYVNVLIQKMLSVMISDHPYHYPIIGFKQDLWNLERDKLFNFYKEHYVPNNAVLVVVGDVNAQEVFEYVENAFKDIKKVESYKKDSFYHSKDLSSTTSIVYRDIQQPILLFSMVLDGIKHNSKYEFLYDALALMLAGGKSSRLVKILVDDLKIATDVQAFSYTLEDLSLFFIYVLPKDVESIDKIEEIVKQEIEKLKTETIQEDEILQIQKKVKLSFLNMMENSHQQASVIADMYVRTGDENFINTYLNFKQEDIILDIKKIISENCNSSILHKGIVLPLDKKDKEYFDKLQKLSDQEDAKILDGKIRTTEVEPAVYANLIKANKVKEFEFFKPNQNVLSNGMKLFSYDTKDFEKIDIIISLYTHSYFDQKDGMYEFLCHMLTEGSKNYSGTLLAQEFEKYGMNFNVQPGYINLSMLSCDFEKGLELLSEILINVEFNENSIEKIRSNMLSDLKEFWDEPSEFSKQLVNEILYKNHPYSKNPVGTVDSLKSISKLDLEDSYKKYINPFKATISVVGNFLSYDIVELLNGKLKDFNPTEIDDLIFPALNELSSEVINHNINRDQVVLCFVGRSVKRLHPDYDALVLFDQIFSGGVNNSMSSRLFELREQTGLFYTIKGSLAANCDEQPGIVFVKTIVSLNMLQEAKQMILKTIDSVIDSITQEELIDAKSAVINSLVENFSSTRKIAGSFLFIDRYNFSDDYFDKKASIFENINLEDVKAAAKKILISDKMITLQVGRV